MGGQVGARGRKIHHKDTKSTKERKRPRWEFVMHGIPAFVLFGPTLVPTKRKPFDFRAEGLLTKKSGRQDGY